MSKDIVVETSWSGEFFKRVHDIGLFFFHCFERFCRCVALAAFTYIFSEVPVTFSPSQNVERASQTIYLGHILLIYCSSIALRNSSIKPSLSSSLCVS